MQRWDESLANPTRFVIPSEERNPCPTSLLAVEALNPSHKKNPGSNEPGLNGTRFQQA